MENLEENVQKPEENLGKPRMTYPAKLSIGAVIVSNLAVCVKGFSDGFNGPSDFVFESLLDIFEFNYFSGMNMLSGGIAGATVTGRDSKMDKITSPFYGAFVGGVLYAFQYRMSYALGFVFQAFK